MAPCLSVSWTSLIQWIQCRRFTRQCRAKALLVTVQGSCFRILRLTVGVEIVRSSSTPASRSLNCNRPKTTWQMMSQTTRALNRILMRARPNSWQTTRTRTWIARSRICNNRNSNTAPKNYETIRSGRIRRSLRRATKYSSCSPTTKCTWGTITSLLNRTINCRPMRTRYSSPLPRVSSLGPWSSCRQSHRRIRSLHPFRRLTSDRRPRTNRRARISCRPYWCITVTIIILNKIRLVHIIMNQWALASEKLEVEPLPKIAPTTSSGRTSVRIIFTLRHPIKKWEHLKETMKRSSICRTSLTNLRILQWSNDPKMKVWQIWPKSEGVVTTPRFQPLSATKCHNS